MSTSTRHIISLTDLAGSLTARFESLRPRMKAWAARVLGSEDDADDALQEAFFRLWRKGDATDVVNYDAMSMTTVRSVCFDMLRSRKVRQTESLERVERSAEETNMPTEIAAEVTELIAARLDQRTRKILLLHDMDGYDYPEIASRFGLTESNCRMIVSRARKNIRLAYRQFYGH